MTAHPRPSLIVRSGRSPPLSGHAVMRRGAGHGLVPVRDLRAAQPKEGQVGRAGTADAHHILATVGANGVTQLDRDVDDITGPELVCLPIGQVVDAAAALEYHDGVL